MPETLKTKLARWRFNFFPAFRGTGGRITYISGDWREVRVEVPLSWRTRNYVGTTYGGSMYAAIDPVYMLMLIKILGQDYVVWDKAAAIRFKKPGTSTLFAHFTISDEELQAIHDSLETGPSTERVYLVELVDARGTIHASIDKTIYIRKREPKGNGNAAG
jgi:acyl-coenzyme A thioesterase PaaI-like protein